MHQVVSLSLNRHAGGSGKARTKYTMVYHDGASMTEVHLTEQQHGALTERCFDVFDAAPEGT